MARQQVAVVADLGFGDAGKGLLTDYLVRALGATLVVRYNGGAQAGHTVVAPDGRTHVFSQFGAGTFVPGVRTFLSRHVVVHPTALLREAAVLSKKGVDDPLTRLGMSENALVITPFHQALGRLRELVRCDRRHGSCGVGVGETVRQALAEPSMTVRAGDLGDRRRLEAKASAIRSTLGPLARRLALSLRGRSGADTEAELFGSDDVLDAWVEETAAVSSAAAILPDRELGGWMSRAGVAVFEGAQGVLLDEWCGFHPFTTWSRCTFDNAEELLSEYAPDSERERIGVLRSHAVRHGPGPLPTETAGLAGFVEDVSRAGPWQGRVRYGWFDSVLARYALECAGPIDRLVITHMDLLERLDRWPACSSYRVVRRSGRGEGLAGHLSPDASLGSLPAEPAARSVRRQARMTRLLSGVEPILQSCRAEPEAVIEHIERSLGRPVDLLSFGPKAAQVVPA